MFSIGNKRRHFLRIGSFNKKNHPPKMPVFYWRERVGSPKLCITKLTSIFAQNIGQINLMFDDESDRTRIDSDTSSDDLSSDESEVELSVPDKVSAFLSTVEINLPDPKEYPLLHSMGCNAMIMDRLIQEILCFIGTIKSLLHMATTKRVHL